MDKQLPPVEALDIMKEIDAFSNEMEEKYPNLRGLYIAASLLDPEKNTLQPMVGGGAVNGSTQCGACFMENIAKLLHVQQDAGIRIAEFEEELREASFISTREALH